MERVAAGTKPLPDLGVYTGQDIVLPFGNHTDGSFTRPRAYIDDVVISD